MWCSCILFLFVSLMSVCLSVCLCSIWPKLQHFTFCCENEFYFFNLSRLINSIFFRIWANSSHSNNSTEWKYKWICSWGLAAWLAILSNWGPGAEIRENLSWFQIFVQKYIQLTSVQHGSLTILSHLPPEGHLKVIVWLTFTVLFQ